LKDFVETRLDSETRLEGGFLTVLRDRVVLPDGTVTTREYIRHPGAVAVVPLLDDGRLVLVRQYRYPIHEHLIEWPAGKIDPGESVLDCARRELREETGYTAREWARAAAFHNAAAYSSEVMEIWFARGLVSGPQQLDHGEFVQTCIMSESELDALAAAGKISDMKTMIGLQWLQRWRAGPWALEWHAP
jgi:ADP-ribose pyrophosphatase